MEEQRYNNNLVVKYDESKPPVTKVYKCPYLNCKEFFFDYDSLNSHLVLKHADVPKFFFNSSDHAAFFTIKKIGKLRRYNLKSTINKHIYLLKVFVEDEKTKGHKKHIEHEEIKWQKLSPTNGESLIDRLLSWTSRPRRKEIIKYAEENPSKKERKWMKI